MNILNEVTENAPAKALAVIIQQEGSAYRPLGAIMAIYPDGEHLGHVSSGCIEADIVAQSLNAEAPFVAKYGKGSKFKDLVLPCGGGMDILILPNPDIGVLASANRRLNQRIRVALSLNIATGEIQLSDASDTELNGEIFYLAMKPAQKFFVFGNGQEAVSFAELVAGAGHPIEFHSTDKRMLKQCSIDAQNTHHLVVAEIPHPDQIDQWSSVVLFFHEHDLETQILRDALTTPAFYIGAQGSFTAQMARLEALRNAGETEEALARIKGPIGLIPKVRDPQTLAISVLAEIHKTALAELE